MNRPATGATTGERVAFYRRRAGLTQHQLAELVGRSKDWTGKIESHVWELNRLPILQKVADTLGVTIAELNPAVAVAPHVEGPNDARPTGPDVAPLLATLTAYPQLAHLYEQPDDGELPLPDALRRNVNRLFPLVQRGDSRQLVRTLARILPKIDQGAARARRSESIRQWRQAQSVAYTAAAQVLDRLGRSAAAWVAADRASTAAIATGDWYEAATATLSVARLLHSQGRLDEALSAALAVERAAKATKSEDAPPGHLALVGSTHLILAQIRASQGNSEQARRELRLAERLATRLARHSDRSATNFGPPTVSLTALDIALTLGEPGAALDIADHIDTGTLTTEEHARVLLATARAHIQRRDPTAAINLLLQAEAMAPDVIRHDPDSLDTVRDLGALAKRVRGKELAALRQRIESTT